MCGIAGIVDLNERPISTDTVRAMCCNLERRGPDAEGVVALSGAVLGHRRLAVLDLSPRGNQPMATADGRLAVVFNGQVYNHLELRGQLEAGGASYRSRTDTESLLYGYRAWGSGISARCRGMWAFAVWDAAARTLFLSRDRLGEKPLYYHERDGRLAFASTLAGLRPALTDPSISPDAVASLLAYQYVPHTEAIYEGVRKLWPGHHLSFGASGVRSEAYWTLAHDDKLDVGPEESERLVEEALAAAVAEQLEADVPVGVFLSGGVDSGYVAALAAQRKPGIVSITMTTPGAPERDEAAAARLIAERHGTTHVEVPLDQRCISDLPGLLAAGEPHGDSSLLPAAAVARAARTRLTVVLTGDGGDESFDGYGHPRIARAAQALRRGPTAPLWRALAPLMTDLSRRRLTPGLRRLRLRCSREHLLAGAGLERWLGSRDAAPRDVRRALYGPRLAPLAGRPPGAFLVELARTSRYREPWEATLAVGIRGRLAGDYLVKMDTATMYHSLESRAPFLDHRVVELAARLPYERLFPDGFDKGLLRRLAARHNPPSIVYASKKGFGIPVDRYFRGRWGDLLRELTADGVAAQLGLIEPRGVRRLLRAHGHRASTRVQTILFTLLALEIWLRVFHARENSPEELGERLLRGVDES
jgi:asparagine synthase (glutamine-hydrolysing)